ncbi:ABC transporter substrate-binding protein [Benzoatithermus flavus]|uniref:ABC transporter substrate-binding protein n=1 Tax=Benzoatithermus flavus TaxID=3108223 RepID=A0ABU8XSA7_9PROT
MRAGIRRFLLGVAACAAMATVAQARDLTVTSWGGSYQDAQRKVFFEPFQKETGIKLVEDSWDGGIGALRAKAEGAPTWDLVQVEADELVLGCDEGIIEPLDWSKLGGKDAFLPEAVHECGVGAIVWANVLAYDGDKFKDNPPKSWADFFDTKKYPGKRALRKGPRQALEFALMADGVPNDQIYATLKTPEGVDRAFKKLDSIKKDLIFWEAGAQPPQLLGSGEVVMTSAYNGRITAANKTDKRNFKIAWDAGFVYQIDSWVIPKNSDKKDEAMKLLAYLVAPEHQKLLPPLIPYGPTNKAAVAQVDPAVMPDVPTAPQNLPHGLFYGREFWADNVEKLNERFNSWAAKS